MYIFGGWDGKNSFGDMHQFNFVTNAWTEIPKQEFTPSPRRTHVAFVNQDKMYIFGGFDESRPAESFNELYSFDFVEKKWSLVQCNGDIPSGRSRCGQFLWKNFLYILGGWDRVRHFTDLYRLNLDTNEWEDCQTNLSSISSGIAQHSCVVIGDWLHVYGGKFISNTNMMMASDRILVMRLGVSNPLPSSEPVVEEDMEEMMMDEVMDERMQLLRDCMEDFMEMDTIKEVKGRSSYSRSFPVLCSSVSC
jgi:N-acetylneuraminic acid mutarotase